MENSTGLGPIWAHSRPPDIPISISWEELTSLAFTIAPYSRRKSLNWRNEPNCQPGGRPLPYVPGQSNSRKLGLSSSRSVLRQLKKDSEFFSGSRDVQEGSLVTKRLKSLAMKKTKSTISTIGFTCFTLAAGSAPAALIAHYEFEGDYTDSTGNGHTGVAVGSGSIVNDPEFGNVYQNPSTSSPNSYLNLDGTLAIPNFAANSGISLALWVRRDVYTAGTNNNFGPGNLVGALALGTGGDQPTASIGVNNTGGIISFIEGDGGADQVQLLSADGLVPDEVWTHLAVTFDRANDIAKLYVNGFQVGSDFDISLVGDGELDWAGANIGTLAAPGNVVFDFQVRIDDARIYDQVLGASEVAALAIPEPGTAAFLSLAGLLLLRRR